MSRVQLSDVEREFVETYLPVSEYGPYPEPLRQQFEGLTVDQAPNSPGISRHCAPVLNRQITAQGGEPFVDRLFVPGLHLAAAASGSGGTSGCSRPCDCTATRLPHHGAAPLGTEPGAVKKALVDQGFKNTVKDHGAKVGIEFEVVKRAPGDTGFVPQPKC